MNAKELAAKLSGREYQYDTRALGLTGFTLPGVKGVMSWSQLRAKWPEWLEAQP